MRLQDRGSMSAICLTSHVLSTSATSASGFFPTPNLDGRASCQGRRQGPTPCMSWLVQATITWTQQSPDKAGQCKDTHYKSGCFSNLSMRESPKQGRLYMPEPPRDAGIKFLPVTRRRKRPPSRSAMSSKWFPQEGGL